MRCVLTRLSRRRSLYGDRYVSVKASIHEHYESTSGSLREQVVSKPKSFSRRRRDFSGRR